MASLFTGSVGCACATNACGGGAYFSPDMRSLLGSPGPFSEIAECELPEYEDILGLELVGRVPTRAIYSYRPYGRLDGEARHLTHAPYN